MEPTLKQNKAAVVAFYNAAFNEHRSAEAVTKYVGRKYAQHNPTVADGPQAFIEFASGFVKANPALRADIKRVVAEGDLVVTHVHFRLNDRDRGLAAIDIFRLQDGKIVEHWDVIQPVPEAAANSNTMF
jgi:predicted SnoaL-like aldol condensation-catalyzing enzyme